MDTAKVLKVSQKRAVWQLRARQVHKRSVRFTLLMRPDERAALDRLAAQSQRSKGDLIRLLVADALSRLFADRKQLAGRGRNSAAEIGTGTEGSNDDHSR